MIRVLGCSDLSTRRRKAAFATEGSVKAARLVAASTLLFAPRNVLGGGGGGGGGGGRRLEEMLGSRSGTGRWARPDRGTDQRCSCTSLRPSLGRNLSLVFSADSFISKKSKSSVPVAQAEPRSRRGRSTSESQSG